MKNRKNGTPPLKTHKEIGTMLLFQVESKVITRWLQILM
jgi:hypothetical protein